MASLAISDAPDGRRVLSLAGRLDATTIRRIWSEGRAAIATSSGRPVLIDAASVDYCDGAGIALLVDWMRQRKTGEVQVAHLAPRFETLLRQFDIHQLGERDPPRKRVSAVEEVGIIAALLMTPLLTLFADLISLVGGAITLQSFSIPYVTFIHEVEGIVDYSDFMAGFVKSFVFAVLVAGIGCLRGLQTTAGSSAVGDAATRAVVSGIILLVVVDGVFAVIYFVLDI
jgi:ABC-type transporter Mla MlaB component